MAYAPLPGHGAPRPGSSRLVIAGRHAELRRAGEWLRELAAAHGLDRQLGYGLELAMDEALTNVMNYAYPDGGTHDIVLELRATPDGIALEIADDGVPFNPLDHAIDELSADLEKSRPTGRGVRLMRQFMDDITYVRRDGRNVLTLVLRLRAS